MAHVLGWMREDKVTGEVGDPDAEKVRKLLKNGKAKEYSRELVPYPVTAPRLPSRITANTDQGRVRFGKSASEEL